MGTLSHHEGKRVNGVGGQVLHTKHGSEGENNMFERWGDSEICTGTRFSVWQSNTCDSSLCRISGGGSVGLKESITGRDKKGGRDSSIWYFYSRFLKYGFGVPVAG